MNEAEYAAWMQSTVEPELRAVREEGYFPAHDALRLHYEIHPAKAPTCALVLLHGFCESAEKLRELIWRLWRDGISVFAYDHRGHGLSEREVASTELTHVADFGQYVSDLQCFIDSVVTPRAGALPKALFGHSMGGAVAALYLEAQPDSFVRAVLSSPMISPKTKGIPRPLADGIVLLPCLLGLSARKPHMSQPFTEERALSLPGGTDYARCAYYTRKKAARPEYRNYAASWGWLRQAVPVSGRILCKKKCAAVRCPVLIFQAERDRFVRPRAMERLARMLPDARLERIPSSTHEIYMSEDETLNRYYALLIAFLRETR